MMITVGAIAILAGLAMSYSGSNALSGAREARLRHDISALNSAVTAYKHSGGDLTHIKDAAQVISKLKSRVSDAEAALTPGFSGSFLDDSLIPVFQSQEDAKDGLPRAVWNATTQKFEMEQSGPPGIVSLTRANSGETPELNVESRDRAVSYASKGTWVWDYEESSPAALPGPDYFPVGKIPDTNLSTPNPLPPSEPIPISKQPLAAPTFSIPGGTMPTPDFPLLVTLSNPNPTGSSSIAYNINYQNWVSYSGSAIEISPDSVLLAQAIPIDSSKWDPSIISSEEYLASPVTLSPPNIYLSSDFFSDGKSGAVTSIQVALTNTNEPNISKLRFQILPVPGGDGLTTEFVDYSGSFSVEKADYPDGFGVRAYAEASVSGYQNSITVSRYASDQGGLFGGHLDLDTSDFIAKIGGGTTGAHTHDITGKFNLTSIDFFRIPDSNQVTIPEAIPSPNQAFKITVVNADLSPGMSLIMEYSEKGKRKTHYSKVSEYDDGDISSLLTFTLSGSGDTKRLESVSITMDRDVILQAGIIPTNTGDVKGNVPGKNGEWRNGTLTVQAVAVSRNGDAEFTTDQNLSSGGHGAATSGLLWEGALFWHWEGDSYHERDNQYVPGEFSSVSQHVKDLVP
jgi:hypothetical protein